MIAPLQASCFCLWEQCRAIGSTLLSLFQRSLPCFFHTASLVPREIKIGGVENTGNSCIFAVILQEFAASNTDFLLSVPVKQGPDESEIRFSLRRDVQECLRNYINRIRLGQEVKRSEVRLLAEKLKALGWQGDLSSSWWYSLLHRLAPQIFPLPHFSVHELYETILSILLEGDVSMPCRIVLSRKEDARPFPEFFASHPFNAHAPSLWRVALDDSPASLEEYFQIKDSNFSLQVLHAYRTTPRGKHVVIYRKYEEKWICCDDTKITWGKPLANDKIYMAVYTAH